MKLSSIQMRIAMWSGLCLLLTAAVIVTFSAWNMRSTARTQRKEAIQAANQIAAASAGQKAGQIQAQLESAKRQYREAYESGDADKMFDTQQLIAQIGAAQERVNHAKMRFERAQPTEAQPVQQPQAQPQPQAQAVPQPDPKAQEWAEKNEWFGTDEVMTYAAFGIHRKLVEEEGFDPQSEEYYTEVDRRIRAEFPQKFATAKKSSGAQVASAGASASRSTAKSGRRSVKLSPSQIAMAKKLNVPLEEYAKYVKE